MNTGHNRLQLALFVLLLSGWNSAAARDSEPFASEREAAVHFLRPFFPVMDCENMGVISKGEVDDHFFAVFYSVGRLRTFSISLEDLERSLLHSSKEQISFVFAMMDQDGDRAVSTQEFREFMYRAIDLADTGQNGEVTLTDLGMEQPRIIRAHQR